MIDEYTLTQQDPNAEGVLQAHWSSWVTLGDFQRIANSGKGINLVRIPIGYWAFQKYGDDPYVQGAKDYLYQALDWAGQTGLQVWIDLHGAPGSQNGYDNSGQRTGSPQFTSGDTISFTAGVLGQIAQEFGSNPVVVGIQLINEPLMGSLPGGRGGIEDYYGQAYAAVRGSSDKAIVISDGFDDPGSWNGVFPDTIIDHHDYQVFRAEDLELSYQGHADLAYSRAASWGDPGRTVICGEWTAAMTDCALALVSIFFRPHLLRMLLPANILWLTRQQNGYGIGARYDGTYSKPGESSYYIGSCATQNFIDQWSQELKDGTRNYIQAQINSYETNFNGWIFWNFKTEAAAEWDFFRLVDNGVWP